jgi:tRNA(adenine34) deaminase
VIDLPAEIRLNHHMEVTGNILAEEGAEKLKLFFEKRRKTATKRHADERC